MKKQSSVLISLSGGQDSTTLLGYAKNRFERVEAISFNYGQQHSIELEQAAKICQKLGVKQTIIDITFLKDICDSALTTNQGNVNVAHSRMSYLPASFVPNRNLILLTLANTYAQKVGIENILTGTCETDGSGYPDCRRLFIDGLESSLFAACNKLEVSVEFIREVLSIFNTSFQSTVLTENGRELPLITIEEHPTVLEQINSFFGNIGILDEELEKLTFVGYESCSYVYNLVKNTNTLNADLAEFEELFKDKLEQVNPHRVTADSSNYFIPIITPLMYLNKAETFELAEQEGILETVLEDSATCYRGVRDVRHPWGYGCTTFKEDGDVLDECPACTLRRKGYLEFLEKKQQNQ